MLKLEGLKLAPEEKEAAPAPESSPVAAHPGGGRAVGAGAAPLHRRTGGAASGVHRGGGGAAGEAGAAPLPGSAGRPLRPERYALPEVLSRRRCRRWWWAPGRAACLRRWCWPDAACAPFCWSGAGHHRPPEDVETFWRTGVLDPESNVQFRRGGSRPSPTGS